MSNPPNCWTWSGSTIKHAWNIYRLTLSNLSLVKENCHTKPHVGHLFNLFVKLLKMISCNFRNGVNVEGSTHKQVVDLIKSGGDKLTLTGKFVYNIHVFVVVIKNILILSHYQSYLYSLLDKILWQNSLSYIFMLFCHTTVPG